MSDTSTPPPPQPSQHRSYVGSSADAVALAEVKSLKPGARVYERRTPNIFFLTPRETAVANLEAALEAEQDAPPTAS